MNTSLKLTLTFLMIFLISCNQGVFTDPELYEEELAEANLNCKDTTETGFHDGDGSALNPFIVCKRSHLDILRIKMIEEYSQYFDKHFKMTANIDLEGDELEIFLPIGDITDVTLLTESSPPNAKPFQGTFDGDGHVISNFYLEGENFSYIGLFQYLGDNAVVKNLDLRLYFNLSGNNVFVGGIAGYSEGVIENTVVRGVISGDKVSIAGMVSGYQKAGEFKNLSIGGQITTINGVQVGGVSGVISATTLGDLNFLSNISQFGTIIPSKIEGSGDIGGVFGKALDNVTIQNIEPKFIVKCQSDICGGIVGTMQDSILTDVTYRVLSIESSGDYVGGLVGNLINTTVSNINATGNALNPLVPIIKGRYSVGGIAGYAENLTLSSTEIYTDLICTQGGCGGIAGEAVDSTVTSTDIDIQVKGEDPLYIDEFNMSGGFGQASNVSISTSTIKADVIGNKDVGGMIGEALENIEIKNATFEGNIEGYDFTGGTSENIGGLIGRSTNKTTIDNVIVNTLVGNHVSGGISVGGVIGKAEVSGDDEILIKDTDVKYTYISGAIRVGGFIGDVGNKVRISDSTILTDISASSEVGGVFGKAFGLSGFIEVDTVSVTKAVSGFRADGNIGGACGLCEYSVSLNNITINNLDISTFNFGAHSNFGGVVGSLKSGTIENAAITNTTIVDIGASKLGGIVGLLDNSTITSSYIQEVNPGSFEILGASEIGGLVGHSINSNIRKSYSTADIRSFGSRAGGLVGILRSSLLEDSYQRGNVVLSGGDYVGGLVADIATTSILRRSYFGEGMVTGGTIRGGAIALDSTSDNTVTDVVWDTTTSGLVTSAGGTGHNTTQMNSTTPYTNFDFQDIWLYTFGAYPTLR